MIEYCCVVWTKTRKTQALFDIFRSISLLFHTRFADKLSNLPPPAQSSSRICRCILGDAPSPPPPPQKKKKGKKRKEKKGKKEKERNEYRKRTPKISNCCNFWCSSSDTSSRKTEHRENLYQFRRFSCFHSFLSENRVSLSLGMAWKAQSLSVD